MLTEEQARSYIGKPVSILSTAGAGMYGVVWKIEDSWLIVDYGYGIRLDCIEEIEVEPEEGGDG